MYCDRCGTSLTPSSQFCNSCGKRVIPSAFPPIVLRIEASENRVHRHIQLLATLWLARGVLRLMLVFWLLVAGRTFLSGFWGAGIPWPFSFLWGADFLPGLTLVLGLFGLAHLVLAWGLYERQSWARYLGLVLGFLALFRIPFGTALGIYTIWVLLPEASGREYEAMARA